MPILDEQADSIAFDIGAVERETGISKDTLRVWEKRYGFPSPLRGANGARLYPSDQLGRLRTIRSLMDCGMRAGSVVGLTERELDALLSEKRDLGRRHIQIGPMAKFTTLLEQREHRQLQSQLATSLRQLGLQRFLEEIAAPLTVEVGELWAAGRLAVRDEHRYSSELQHLLGSELPRHEEARRRRPRVLLTTVPGELHGLGLLMVQTWLAAEAIDCVCLGTQTPATEIASAAIEYQVDVVGLSFSTFQTTATASAALRAVRSSLDPSIVLWAGGSLWRRVRNKVPGVQYIVDFGDLATAIDAWG